MSDTPDSLDELSSEQVAALVELAEAYQDSRFSRRDLMKLAGVGGAAGLLGGAGWTAATGAGRTTDSDPTPGEQTPRPTDVNASAFTDPGDVQGTIDAVAASGGGSVRLDPTQRYEQPASPWVLKQDVTLDFNGATLYGTGDRRDTDILHLHPGAQLYRPRIDLYDGGNGYTMANSYRGRVFTLDTRYGQYFAFGTTIQNGLVTAVGRGGTACYLGTNGSPPGNAITFCTLNFDVGIPRGAGGDKPAESAMGTALHLDTADGGDNGWINSVTVSGNWRYVGTGILQEGTRGRFNQQKYSFFNCTIQPGSESSDAAWRIADPLYAKGNIFRGLIWDQSTYEYAWKIDSQFNDPERSWRGCKRNAINMPNDLPSSLVRSRAAGDNYVNRIDNFSTKIV
jgi:hypothetical protein